MDMIILILTVSTVMWYVIDRAKSLWSHLSFGKYITIAVSALGAFGVVFAYDLDLIYAIEMVEELSIAGQVLTALCLMGGSSAISEVISKIKVNSSEVE